MFYLNKGKLSSVVKKLKNNEADKYKSIQSTHNHMERWTHINLENQYNKSLIFYIQKDDFKGKIVSLKDVQKVL